MSDDPRPARTRRALHQAILALAAERPAREVSMAALSRAAGVHRSTVYEYTSSPEELLVEALRAQLDQVRADHVSQGLHPRDVVLDVLAHLEAHEAVYRRELLDAPGRVRGFLVEHFRASAATALGEVAPPVKAPLFDDVAPYWIAAASVAAMSVWLNTPRPRDPETYLEVQRALMPPWWPSDQGA